MPLPSNFFPSHVTAYTSDRSVDFSIKGDQLSLSDTQRKFLSSQLNTDFSDPVSVHQVHGDHILMVDDLSSLREADGLLTSQPHLPLAIRTADCLPVFVYDQRQQCIGLVHAGWKGSRDNIAGKAIRLMEKHWRSDPKDITVAFGPAIHSCCHEVGGEFQEYFPDDVVSRDGRYFLSLQKVNKSLLTKAGVPEENIHDCGICTCCDRQYFSYRREGEAAGRMMSLLMINQIH